MLLNISGDYSSKKNIIDTEVGKAFNLEERKKLGGTSLKNIEITAVSIDLYNLMTLNEEENCCSLEMRPRGILIGFQSMREAFALVIPYYKLRIYKGKAEEYSFYRDKYFLKIKAGASDTIIHAFVRKIRQYRADNAPTRIEDVL